MHYDLLQKYIFFCLQIWLFHCDRLKLKQLILLHCVNCMNSSSVHMYLCNIIWGFVFEFQYWLFLYFTLPILEL